MENVNDRILQNSIQSDRFSFSQMIHLDFDLHLLWCIQHIKSKIPCFHTAIHSMYFTIVLTKNFNISNRSMVCIVEAG